MFGTAATAESSIGLHSDTWTSSSAFDDLHARDQETGESELTRAVLETWSTNAPEQLLEIVRSGRLDLPLLTFAAEALGDVSPGCRPAALLSLMGLLRHPRPIIREGAIYGIEKLADGRMPILERLRPMLDDPSPGVREAAGEALGTE